MQQELQIRLMLEQFHHIETAKTVRTKNPNIKNNKEAKNIQTVQVTPVSENFTF